MSAPATLPHDDAAWLATLSPRDIRLMECRVERLFSGEGLKPDIDLEPLVRSVVLQAIIDWQALEAMLLSSAARNADHALATAQTRARLDQLISHDLSHLKTMVSVIDRASDRLGPLWQERLAHVRGVLQAASARAVAESILA